MKCVLEELSEGTLVMFTYESPDDTHLNIKLFDPSGQEIYADTDKPKGSHGFTTEKEGDYKGEGHPTQRRKLAISHKKEEDDLDDDDETQDVFTKRCCSRYVLDV